MTFTTEILCDSLKTLSTTILDEIFRLKIIFFQTVHRLHRKHFDIVICSKYHVDNENFEFLVLGQRVRYFYRKTRKVI